MRAGALYSRAYDISVWNEFLACGLESVDLIDTFCNIYVVFPPQKKDIVVVNGEVKVVSTDDG